MVVERQKREFNENIPRMVVWGGQWASEKKREFQMSDYLQLSGAIHLINEDWIISSDTYHSINVKKSVFVSVLFSLSDLTQQFVVLEMDIKSSFRVLNS